MVTWRIVYTKRAQKDAKKLAAAGLRLKTQALLELLAEDRPPLRLEVDGVGENERCGRLDEAGRHQLGDEVFGRLRDPGVDGVSAGLRTPAAVPVNYGDWYASLGVAT